MTSNVAAPDFGGNREARSLADVERFTRRFITLRGLEFAPVTGAVMLTFLAAGLGWLRPESGASIPVLMLFGAAAVAAWLTRRYVNRSFGVVRPSPAPPSWRGRLLWLYFAILVAAFSILTFTGASNRLHFDFAGLFFPLWAAGQFAVRDRGFRSHWLVPVATGLLLPFVFPYSVPHTPLASLGWAAFWATFLFAQLWDHRLLVRGLDNGRA